MRVTHWLGASLVVAALVGLGTTAASCGSDEAQIVNDVDGSSEAATGDGDLNDGGGFSDGAGGDGSGNKCTPTGTSCTTSSECCSANCDPKLNVCAAPVSGGGGCKVGGLACSVPTDCCTFVCAGGTCGSKLCTSDNQTCTADSECCGGKCTGGKCAPLNGSCKTSGNTCGKNGDCCSQFCNNGVCNNQPSYCTQTNDVCASDFECCTNTCKKAAGATLGTCGALTVPGASGCTIAGQLCGAGANDGGALLDGGIPPCGGECCSRSCGPYKTGVFICQPPSGCRPTGETCRADKDCCGFGGVQGSTGVGTCSFPFAGAPIGRCDNGNACRPAGAICKVNKDRYPDIESCNAENNCCSGNVNQNEFVCTRDTLGIPRCTIGGQACLDGGAPPTGQACASSADCCGLNCVPNPAFTGTPPSPPFVCGAGCVQNGNACTSTADCCSGTPCVQPPGSSIGVCGGVLTPDGGVTAGDSGPPATGADGGTCSLSGQTCTTTGDCCANSGLSCINNRCGVYLR
jgi:hypothetical protein